MNALILDNETTTKNKGNPFTKDNKLCQIGLMTWFDQYKIYDIEYSQNPYGKKLEEVQEHIDKCSLLIGFNIKFDLHWLRRYGIKFQHKKIWDCQIAHFLIVRQREKYPSLDGVATYYQLGKKEDEVAKLWDEGYDTPDIPWDLLTSYLKQDLNLTYKIYLKQKEYFTNHPELFRLFFLEMTDLLILQEMEWNGMRFDKETSLDFAKEIMESCDRIYSRHSFNAPINFTSGDHISALLYGGIVKEKYREVYQFIYKDGRIADKERWSIKEYILPRLLEPLPKSALKKEGFYATDKDTLEVFLKKRIPKEVKTLIEDIIKYNDLDHLNGTYATGLPLQMEKHGDDKYIHGQFNQVVAVTGRLSSSAPNLQNRDKRIDKCFISRF